MARYSIIIGVEHYVSFPPTKFAHADALLLHETLTEFCDYPVQHSLLLQLGPDDEMGPRGVLSSVKKAVESLVPGDTVLFYFSGHGHLLNGKAYLILPTTVPNAYETTALALDDISKELRQPQRMCFRIFDACHSGLDVRGDMDIPDAKGFIRTVTHEASGWVTLAACRDDEYSVSDVDLGHGVFTHYICEYIRALKPEVLVLPELLKVTIVDQVRDHAKRLGFSQTPTLNASISGNIDLAVRRAQAHPPEKKKQVSFELTELQQRVEDLRQVPELIQENTLTELLNSLVTSMKEKLEEHNKLSPGSISVGDPILANDIPGEMRSDIVSFARQNGLSARHELGRWEEEYEFPLFGLGSAMSEFLPKRKTKQVHYDISQPRTLPKSAVILYIPGDGRCVPTLKLLIYVIPLQLTCCLLVLSFREQWVPREGQLELLCQSSQMYKPGMKTENVNELASFAAVRTIDSLQNYVSKRLSHLEGELED